MSAEGDEKEAPQQVQAQFFARLCDIPVINSAWGQACSLYSSTKERNAFFEKTLSLAEAGWKKAADTTRPLVVKCQPGIDKVNDFACRQLDNLEEKFPSVKTPTEEVIEGGKSMIQPAVDKVNAVKQYGADKVNAGKEMIANAKQKAWDGVESVKSYGSSVAENAKEKGSDVGQYVENKVDSTLTFSEECLEKYLPELGDEDENVKKEMDECSSSAVSRAKDLTLKTKARLYKRALRDFSSAHSRLQEQLNRLKDTVNMMELSKGVDSAKNKSSEMLKETQDKVLSIWQSINEDNSPDEKPETLEGKSMYIARAITGKVKQGLSTVRSYIPDQMQPAAMQERLKDLYSSSEELYNNFKDATNFDEISSKVIQQSKEKLESVQSTLTYITQTYVTVPSNWVSVDVDLKDLAIEDDDEPSDCNGEAGKMKESKDE